MEFFILASAHFLALLSPGPDFFLIVQTSIRLPLRYAFSVCAGIAAANGFYIMLAILGLKVINEISYLMTTLKYLGALYLLYIGFLLLKAPANSFENKSVNALHVKSMKRQFVLGFMSGFLNPKNVIFYFSLFTAIVSPETSFKIKIFYGIWMCFAVFSWDMLVAFVLGNKRVKQGLANYLFKIEKLSGIILASFGILLIFE